MPRHSYNRQTKLTDVKDRIDYISNPERQEHLYTTYSTTDDPDFWDKLIVENQYEYEKYGCKGKMIQAREWVIALEESLVNENPDEVIRTFVDAFKAKYGVECMAGLHHNKTKTNYHIHMVFSERQLLQEPIEKVATRNMFYDEFGKHQRTKKAICDAAGNIRKGCTIIKKGEVYERTIFQGKHQQFKTKQFTKEVKQLFTKINNSYIKEETRKLQVFNPDSVYLATKKIGVENPLEKIIRADNAIRTRWNLTADTALAAGVPRAEIMTLKTDQINHAITESIHENGEQPGLFRVILQRAIDMLMTIIEKKRKPTIPKAPEKSDLLKKYPKLKETQKAIKQKNVEILLAERELRERREDYDAITGLFKKKEKDAALAKITGAEIKYHKKQKDLQKIVMKAGYATVEQFTIAHETAKEESREYTNELQEYERKYADKDIKAVTQTGKLRVMENKKKEVEKKQISSRNIPVRRKTDYEH